MSVAVVGSAIVVCCTALFVHCLWGSNLYHCVNMFDVPIGHSPNSNIQSTHAGKPQVAYPTVKRLLIHTLCAMNLQKYFECHGILQLRWSQNTESVAFLSCVACTRFQVLKSLLDAGLESSAAEKLCCQLPGPTTAAVGGGRSMCNY